jgi:hypothetical protein
VFGDEGLKNSITHICVHLYGHQPHCWTKLFGEGGILKQNYNACCSMTEGKVWTCAHILSQSNAHTYCKSKKSKCTWGFRCLVKGKILGGFTNIELHYVLFNVW